MDHIDHSPTSNSNSPQPGPSSEKTSKPASSRRKFLGQLGGAAAATVTLGGMLASGPEASAETGGSHLDVERITPPRGSSSDPRVVKSFALRVLAATEEAIIPVPPHTTNGDEQRYPDKSGTYTKGLLQDGYGRVNIPAYQSLKHAFATGNPADFENIIIGGTRTQNGPQGALAFGLIGTDGVQFGNAPSPANQQLQVVVPPAPAVAGAAYGTELVELYWGSLLRDVAFTDYPSNSLANQAAAEISSMPSYAGPRNGSGQVTPQLLFRGGYPGETIGPYMSQLHLIPTALGAQELSQQLITYLPNIDYLTDLGTWQQAQNGIDTGLRNQPDSQPRYLHDGRGLSAYTHVDVLYQAYFTALLVLGTIGAPVNPGSPYKHSRTQNGFGTFGAPDFAACLGEIAARSLDVVWYQKWVIHLRHRPESGGGIVDLIQTGQGNTINAHVNSNVMNSQAVAQSFSKYGSYLLSQAFPEGAPTHPAYPTGHGTVGGACITLLKFFFDGSFVIPNPVVPTSDGLSLVPYTGSDAGQITVNGELNKLGHNISFGHGIHAGIHWRSDTDSSLILGESLAISFLQDRAQGYNEKFTVHLTKFDGSIATISNQ
jgi:hypothetical protein